ncbi:protocadherin gamma-C5-like [Polyodon spathula]|uniref:protocadherin gamma-C5-like n=1 Tax=Polyodon spathula TaxID=7913 RepID=UPI001B7EEDA0|nr:protocadherin gamma-C5-like [Polyodon spathula]
MIMILKIPESRNPGTRFPLESAQDPDVGTNRLHSYNVNTNGYFTLNVKNLEDGRKVPELILDKSLDRETSSFHKLVLTAIDVGNPARSGTTQLKVMVVDNNDNAPQFDKALYKKYLNENTPPGNVAIKLKAIDLDDGVNGEVQYYLDDLTPDVVHKLFNLNSQTGEITVTGQLDYEETNLYAIDVIAKDKDNPEMEGHCKVQIHILDVNNNAPEIILTSLPSPVLENASIGTVITL